MLIKRIIEVESRVPGFSVVHIPKTDLRLKVADKMAQDKGRRQNGAGHKGAGT